MGVEVDTKQRRAAEGKVPKGWITPEADYIRTAKGEIVKQDGSVSGQRVARKGKAIPPEQAEEFGITGEAKPKPKAKAVAKAPRDKAVKKSTSSRKGKSKK